MVNALTLICSIYSGGLIDANKVAKKVWSWSMFVRYLVDLTLTLTLILFHFTKTVHMIFYNSHLGYKMTNDGKYFNNY